jgi:Rieske Fe-S protein
MQYGNIHKSAKNKNQQHFVGLIIGGAGVGGNTSNMGMVATGNPESVRGANNNEGSVENERVGEDIQMMNIPAEGNADHLNKSTKLTLSSKK